MLDVYELRKLLDKYLETKDDVDKDDWYASARRFASKEVGDFIDWIHQQQQKKVVK